MSHLTANWKKYAMLGASVVVAGAVQQGYLPAPVAQFLLGLFGG